MDRTLAGGGFILDTDDIGPEMPELVRPLSATAGAYDRTPVA